MRTARNMKIRKGDQVLVIAGKDKGKRGRVLTAFPETLKVTVEGLHLVKKHRRPRRTGEKGQMVLLPRAVSIAKVKLMCPKCGQATRVGYRVADGKKSRVCKKCKSEID